MQNHTKNDLNLGLQWEMQREASVYEQVHVFEVSAKTLHFDSKIPLDHEFFQNHCFDQVPQPLHLIRRASLVHQPTTNAPHVKKMKSMSKLNCK